MSPLALSFLFNHHKNPMKYIVLISQRRITKFTKLEIGESSIRKKKEKHVFKKKKNMRIRLLKKTLRLESCDIAFYFCKLLSLIIMMKALG